MDQDESSECEHATAERAAKLRAQKHEAELRMRKVKQRLEKITKQDADDD